MSIEYNGNNPFILLEVKMGIYTGVSGVNTRVFGLETGKFGLAGDSGL